MAKSRSKVLKVLQRLHPDKVWKTERDGFGWHYTTADGWNAHWVSRLVSTHPDDSDGHHTIEFYIYKEGLPTERVGQLCNGIVLAIP